MEPPKPHPKEAQRPREKPMQVMVLGLSRSGTMSTYVALKQLGYTPYHCMEVGLNHANGAWEQWDKATRAKFEGSGRIWQGDDFERVMWNYDAITDIPCVLFVDELLEAYPGAKIVLLTREPKAWATSVRSQFTYFLSGWRWVYLRLFDQQMARPFYRVASLSFDIWSKGDRQNLNALQQGLSDHNAHVRKVVPKDRLLEWQVTEGWEPLCQFLGKPVPSAPFPKINEGVMLREMLDRVMLGRMFAVLPKAILSVGLPLAVGFIAWKMS